MLKLEKAESTSIQNRRHRSTIFTCTKDMCPHSTKQKKESILGSILQEKLLEKIQWWTKLTESTKNVKKCQKIKKDIKSEPLSSEPSQWLHTENMNFTEFSILFLTRIWWTYISANSTRLWNITTLRSTILRSRKKNSRLSWLRIKSEKSL